MGLRINIYIIGTYVKYKHITLFEVYKTWLDLRSPGSFVGCSKKCFLINESINPVLNSWPSAQIWNRIIIYTSVLSIFTFILAVFFRVSEAARGFVWHCLYTHKVRCMAGLKTWWKCLSKDSGKSFEYLMNSKIIEQFVSTS